MRDAARQSWWRSWGCLYGHQYLSFSNTKVALRPSICFALSSKQYSNILTHRSQSSCSLSPLLFIIWKESLQRVLRIDIDANTLNLNCQAWETSIIGLTSISDSDVRIHFLSRHEEYQPLVFVDKRIWYHSLFVKSKRLSPYITSLQAPGQIRRQ
jgi:hypothetical protein